MLGKGHFALGKGFAECRTRQRVHDKKLIGKDLFAECHVCTRQRKVVMTAHSTLTDALPSAPLHGTQQRIFFENFFAECSPSWHSAKKKVFF
jgi:hypothetical protein